MIDHTVPGAEPPKLSVVIPVYNEEAGLGELFERLYPALDGLGIGYEVLFVDDGSHDNSAAATTTARSAHHGRGFAKPTLVACSGHK